MTRSHESVDVARADRRSIWASGIAAYRDGGGEALADRRPSSAKRLARAVHAWASPILDPVRALQGLRGYVRYWADYAAYRRLPGAEPLRVLDLRPSLHERTGTHELDPHYFYLNAWAMRRLAGARPTWHLDVGSQIVLASLASATIPIVYADYRPLRAGLPGLHSIAGDLLKLPCRDASVPSLSCLHVAEHVGLGRYGDPLDPAGTRKAAVELRRVLAPGGNLYFALPVGRPRLCFNAHRIHAPREVLALFADLELIECSGVDDDGRFLENTTPDAFAASTYACGMFWFRRDTA